jgi:hypothetical protein
MQGFKGFFVLAADQLCYAFHAGAHFFSVICCLAFQTEQGTLELAGIFPALFNDSFAVLLEFFSH